MFSQIGTTEMLIIIIVLITLFGGKRIADLGRELGRTSKELKKAKKELDNIDKNEHQGEEHHG